MESVPDVLDLSKKKLKKLNKPSPEESQVTVLILDDNELQRLDNIDSFTKVQKLSAVRNQLLRMYGVCRLHSLHTLNLAHNGILTIEGLKELIHLKRLILAGNDIKTIEHLNSNVNLEHLDLSENSITHVTDLSFLKNLKELLLHNNKIGHLRQCDRFLPASLVTLTLANNNISDLNEISWLTHLKELNSLTFANNPCVNMTGSAIGFDYRPFIINWCMNLRVIDGYVVDAIESLRAEWLYSQGRGRHFRIGDQEELCQYLATVCPLTGEARETEEDRKLRLILSKAQHHQQQLRNQQSNSETPNPSPITKKKLHAPRNSPRLRLKSRSPDKMSMSYHSSSSLTDTPLLMTQSLDPTMLSQTDSNKMQESTGEFINKNFGVENELCSSPLQALSKMVPVPESLMSPDFHPTSLIKRSGNSVIPTPVAKTQAKIVQPVRSPKAARINSARNKVNATNDKKYGSPTPPRNRKILTTNNTCESPKTRRKSLSSEEESEMCDSKLQNIQMKVEERRQKDAYEQTGGAVLEDKVDKAATCIQKIWRGYYTRNKNQKVQALFKNLQSQRADQYIQKLAADMESTKAALESERKMQMLQMQAINALWKKVANLQPDEGGSSSYINMTNLTSAENAEIVKGLAETCTVLQSQIQQLQGSMHDIVKFMALFSQSMHLNQGGLKDTVIGTQTEITAVHTPQGDAGKEFPYHKQTRPSSLPLPTNHPSKKEGGTNNGINPELKHYAGTLVDGVIKTVSETKASCTDVNQAPLIYLENDDTSKSSDSHLLSDISSQADK